MRIVCPACSAEYEIPDHAVPAKGAEVCCAACGDVWFIAPPGAAAVSTPPVAADKTTNTELEVPAYAGAGYIDEGLSYPAHMPAPLYEQEAPPVSARHAPSQSFQTPPAQERPADTMRSWSREPTVRTPVPREPLARESAREQAAREQAAREQAAKELAAKELAAKKLAAKAARQRSDPGKPLISGRTIAIAWAASIILLLCSAGAGLMFRDDVVVAWPPSARLYAWIGH